MPKIEGFFELFYAIKKLNCQRIRIFKPPKKWLLLNLRIIGLLEPAHIIVIFIFLLSVVCCPIWGYKAGAQRTIGSIGGMVLGFFFNLLGILIVYCTKKVEKKQPDNFIDRADELQKYKQLLDSGAITEA
jgi:hypothetical protein